jgi:hypothetical protein
VKIWELTFVNLIFADNANGYRKMVGARGIEPLTSSASGKRSPTELSAYSNPYITTEGKKVKIKKKAKGYRRKAKGKEGQSFKEK